MSRILTTALLAVVVFVAGYVLMARFDVLSPAPATVLAQYGESPSKFTAVDGVPIRFRDQGQGPVIVLLHAGRMSLDMWDRWADILSSKYRVIRPDMPPFGLSGPDNSGRNDGDRAADLVSQLLTQLGVTKYALAGISSGSTVAIRLAVKHPDAVTALVLASVPVAPPPPGRQPQLLAAVTWVSNNLLAGYRPKLYWREQLKNTFGVDAKVTDEMVETSWALNGIPGHKDQVDRYVAANAKSGYDYAAATAKLTMPVLIQWGGASPVLPTSRAGELAAMFTATEKPKVVIYPGVGHYVYLELPDETARDADAFLTQHPPPAG